MSFNGIRRNEAIFWIGIALLIVTSAYTFTTHGMNELTVSLMLLGVLMTQQSFFIFVGIDREARDERARKIGTMAAALSWYASLMFIGFFAVFDYWGGPQITAMDAFGIAIFLLAVVMAISTVYYSMKGDVE